MLWRKNDSRRSWFREGLFMPSIGLFGLFEGKALSFKKGSEKVMLDSFKKSFEAKEFSSYIKIVDDKREENTIRLADARKKIGKG
jgi:hypothetical protein